MYPAAQDNSYLGSLQVLLTKREGSGAAALNGSQSSSDLDVWDSQHQTTQPIPSAIIIY